MNLAAIENAVFAWVQTALPAFGQGQIFFAMQNGAQPAGAPFVTILLSQDMIAKGAFDEQVSSTNLANPGTEITNSVFGQREFTCSIQAYAENTVTLPSRFDSRILPGTSGRTAVDLLMSVQTALGLDGVRAGLVAAGIAPIDAGTIRRLEHTLIETYFEGRAGLDVRFRTCDTATETNGYIKEVTGTGSLTEDGQPTRTAPFDVVGS